MQELETEMENPTGITTVSRPPLLVNVVMMSKECGILIEVREAEGLKSQRFWRKVTTCRSSFLSDVAQLNTSILSRLCNRCTCVLGPASAFHPAIGGEPDTCGYLTSLTVDFPHPGCSRFHIIRWRAFRCADSKLLLISFGETAHHVWHPCGRSAINVAHRSCVLCCSPSGL